MAEKLELVRKAMPKGLSAGDSPVAAAGTSLSGFTPPQAAPFQAPLTADTTVQQGNFSEPQPLPEVDVAQSVDATIPSYHVYDIRESAGVHTCLIKSGWVQGRDPTLGAYPLAAWALPTVDGTAMATTRKTIEVGKTLYCRVATTSDDLVTTGGSTIVSETPTPASTHAQPAQQSIDMAETVAAVPGVYYYPIADFVIGPSGRLVVANQYQSGGPIMHAPGRNGHASSIHFVDCDGGSLAFLNVRQGLETTNLGYKEIECGCDGGTTSSASPAATTYRQEGSEP